MHLPLEFISFESWTALNCIPIKSEIEIGLSSFSLQPNNISHSNWQQSRQLYCWPVGIHSKSLWICQWINQSISDRHKRRAQFIRNWRTRKKMVFTCSSLMGINQSARFGAILAINCNGWTIWAANVQHPHLECGSDRCGCVQFRNRKWSLTSHNFNVGMKVENRNRKIFPDIIHFFLLYINHLMLTLQLIKYISWVSDL